MIAIIDYQAGNIASVKNALDRLGVESVVTADPEVILAADGVIFPGQGRAGSAMAELKKTGLDKTIPQISKPFLGVCLGMQLLADTSDEDDTPCLGIIRGRCRQFPPTLKRPQLGWNRLRLEADSPLTEGIKDGSYLYFVHSYYFEAEPAAVRGTAVYGFEFPALLQQDNFYAVQFHPEKSGPIGQRLLKNFCELSQ